MDLVDNGRITTNEELLSDHEFALYEYHKYLLENKYPFFVLSYVGAKSCDSPKHELVWGYPGIEEQIQAMRSKILANQAGSGRLF